MKFSKLVKRLVLRNVKEERSLTALSVLGVALGLGLFTGVNVATDRALRSFETTIAGLDPAFQYEVVDASGIDFPEDVYKTVRNFGVECLPMASVNAYLPATNETLDINAIYTVKSLPFLAASPAQKLDAEHFFKDPNGVFVSKKFAESHRLRKGDAFSAYVYSSAYVLRITDVLDAPSLPENTAYMDLGNFQEYFNRKGYLTRIDVGSDEKTAEAIGRVLPAGIVIEKKQLILDNRAALINAFRFNLRFVTFLAVLVGVFLLYNTVFISVVKRRTEIGILRGLGMDRKTVVALFSAQGMFLGLAGSLLGIVVGRLCAWFSVIAVEKTVTQFYRSAAMSDYSITWSDAFVTVVLGLAVSFFASLAPALESANVRPNESSREGTLETSYRSRQGLFSVIGLIAIISGGAAAFIDYRYAPFHFPWLSYAGIVLFILGCTFNAPALLGAGLKAMKRPLYRLFKADARVAVGDIGGSRYRFSIALMSVAVSAALIVALVSSVYSFRTSFLEWVRTYIVADVYVKPASCASNFCYYPLPDDVVSSVEHAPGVERVGRYRALQVMFRGRQIVAGFGDSDLLWKYRPGISREETDRIRRLAQYPEVSISDYVKVTYGLKRGDRIEIQTPNGKRSFTVNNTSISYSTMSGFFYLDRRWLKEYWGLDDATQLSVYLAKGRDARGFIQALQKTLGSAYALEITDNGELRSGVLRIFDKSFALTYTIELIAITISLIGVVNALLILVFEKKREISVLRYLGASWRHIRRIMILSAGIVGMCGAVTGSVMGSVIGVVITRVINKISFGWEVDFRIPLLTVSLLMALLFAATVLAGLAPFSLARKIDPKAFISSE